MFCFDVRMLRTLSGKLFWSNLFWFFNHVLSFSSLSS